MRLNGWQRLWVVGATAYGNMTAVVLALVALACVRYESTWRCRCSGYSIWSGFLTLVYANIATLEDRVDPAQLGASYYLAVLNVPAMVVVHVLIFPYLLRWRATKQPQIICR